MDGVGDERSGTAGEEEAAGALAGALGGGDSEFLRRFSTSAAQVAQELGVPHSGDVDILFLGFLRAMARFGLFEFGPVTIYVPVIDEIVRRTARDPDDASVATLIEFSRHLRAEQQRTGRRRIDELHLLLAFMGMKSGLPARVFGELGVTPDQVEEYARTGRMPEVGLEKLFTPEEAAEYLGIHVQTVRAWIRSGRLKASRLAGQRALRIRASDLASVLEPVGPEEVSE
jgi:excisionase family DNA binding protein